MAVSGRLKRRPVTEGVDRSSGRRTADDGGDAGAHGTRRLILRQPDARDKRVALFSLTAAAQEKFNGAQKILQEIKRVALADLPESERAHFISSLDKVAKALKRLSE